MKFTTLKKKKIVLVKNNGKKKIKNEKLDLK